MNNNVEEHKNLPKMSLLKSWFTWICFGQICYNYERMMGLGFAHSMIPVLEKLYGNDEELLSESLSRHMAFYNTENTWGSIILGIVISLEEEKAKTGELDPEVISSVKTALMGPVAGIGDSITQALVKVILLAIAIDFALQGSPVGVLIFIFGFSAYALIVSYVMFNSGYKFGKNAVVDLLRGGRLQGITEALGVVGMIVLGALVANNIRVTTPLVFTLGEVVVELQPMLDTILPNLLNLVLFFVVYKLLKDEKKPNTIILILFGAAAIFALTGIL